MSMARGVVTRVLSVRCNDTDLALCAQFLESKDVFLANSSDIIKHTIGLVAQQAVRAGIPTMHLQDAREYLAARYGNAGTHRNVQTYGQNAFSQTRMPQMNVDVIQQKPKIAGREVTGAQIMEFVQWLEQQGLTKDQCSYEQYLDVLEQNRKAEIQKTVQTAQLQYNERYGETVPAGCDPSLPIAVSDAPEELNTKALERQQREQEEKLAMEQFTRSLQGEQTNT